MLYLKKHPGWPEPLPSRFRSANLPGAVSLAETGAVRSHVCAAGGIARGDVLCVARPPPQWPCCQGGSGRSRCASGAARQRRRGEVHRKAGRTRFGTGRGHGLPAARRSAGLPRSSRQTDPANYYGRPAPLRRGRATWWPPAHVSSRRRLSLHGAVRPLPRARPSGRNGT